MDLNDNSVSFRIGDLLKTTKPRSRLCQVIFPAFSDDKSLCVVETLKEYLSKTESNRKGETKLLLSWATFKPISRDPLSRWTKLVLKDSGIDLKKFPAHSTRSASSSKALSKSVSIHTILNIIGCKSDNTFVRYYKKKIVSRDFVKSLLT
ncbi:hypothetical protein SNE40_002278 [Patella caerulea]|uniref:Tyr recombinase domain-containing protein n=1 Tax=Patella caerulea TaxID=87958 RepID=A0AAN8PYY6_PATCE